MKILLLGLGNSNIRFSVPPHNPENYVRDIPGYEIITFGYNEGVDIRIEPDDDFGKVIERLPPGWVPDYCYMQNLMGNMLPRGIENAPFPTVYLAMDWDWYIHLARTNTQSVDLELVGGEYARECVEAIGAVKPEVFYDCGIMKEYFPAEPVKIKDRKHDIFYTFQNYGDSNSFDRRRYEWILKLCELAETFKYNVLIVPHVFPYERYLSFLRNSKLALSYNRDGHMSTRVIEAGSQGTVIMDTGEQIKKYFEPEKEYIPVTLENFFEQVKKHLGDQDRLQEMSDRFHLKVKEEFESRRHFKKLIELTDSLLNKKTRSRKYNELSPAEKAVRRAEVYYFVHFRGVRDGYFINQANKFLDLSITEFENALAHEPTPRAKTGLAVVKASITHESETAHLDEAVSLLNEVIDEYSLYAVAYFNLGLVHIKQDKEKALKAFEEALIRFRDNKSEVDPWCLYNREFEFKPSAFAMGKTIDRVLLMLCRGEKDKAYDKLRKLYEAASLYYISLIEENNGNEYKALECLIEAGNACPESGLISAEAANRLAILGYKNESLDMYRKAINQSLFDLDLKIRYIKLLYYHEMDREALAEIKNALRLAKTVSELRRKLPELEYVMSSFGRFSKSCYSHDSCREGTINGWLENLYLFLRSDPSNFNFVLRIVQLNDQAGRVDKIFEVMDEYTAKYLNEKTPGEVILAVKDVYDYLEQVCAGMGRFYQEKLEKLNVVISGLHRTGVPG